MGFGRKLLRRLDFRYFVDLVLDTLRLKRTSLDDFFSLNLDARGKGKTANGRVRVCTRRNPSSTLLEVVETRWLSSCFPFPS